MSWVLEKNGLFGALKIVCLPLMLVIGISHGAFVSWVIPVCLLLLPVNVLLHRRIAQAAPRAVEPEPRHPR